MINELGPNDWRFKAIKQAYEGGNAKKVGAVVCQNPNAHWNQVEEALLDADYGDMVQFADELNLEQNNEEKMLNEVRRMQKLAGLLKENDEMDFSSQDQQGQEFIHILGGSRGEFGDVELVNIPGDAEAFLDQAFDDHVDELTSNGQDGDAVLYLEKFMDFRVVENGIYDMVYTDEDSESYVAANHPKVEAFLNSHNYSSVQELVQEMMGRDGDRLIEEFLTAVGVLLGEEGNSLEEGMDSSFEEIVAIHPSHMQAFDFDVDAMAKEAFLNRYQEGVDYEWAYGRGDDFPNAVIIKNPKLLQDRDVKMALASMQRKAVS